MCSVNLFDQRAIDRVVTPAGKGRIGFIAKRPIGNAPWLHAERPSGNYCEQYWLRMKAMGLDFGADWARAVGAGGCGQNTRGVCTTR